MHQAENIGNPDFARPAPMGGGWIEHKKGPLNLPAKTMVELYQPTYTPITEKVHPVSFWNKCLRMRLHHLKNYPSEQWVTAYRSDYCPDAWVLFKVVTPKETIYKVLAGWYGGYTGSDSWKINSGIESYEVEGEGITFVGYSGSKYLCHKQAERMTSLMASTFSYIKAEVLPECKIIEMSFVEFVEEFQNYDE